MVIGVTSIVFLTTLAPSEMAGELMRAGYRVWEALSISEVLHLCDTEEIDAAVIDHSVSRDLSAVQGRKITVKLQPDATAAALIWELALLFGENDAVVH